MKSALIKQPRRRDLHLLHKEHLTSAYLTQPARFLKKKFNRAQKNQLRAECAQLFVPSCPIAKEKGVPFCGLGDITMR